MRKTVGVFVVILALVLGGSFSIDTTSAEAQSATLPPGLLAGNELPADSGFNIKDAPVGSLIPEDLRAGLWELAYRGLLSDVNTVVWDGHSSRLVFYAADPGALLPELSRYLPPDRISVVRSAHSRAEVDAALGRLALVGGKLTESSRVEMAYATDDGSELVLEITGEPKQAERVAAAQLLGEDLPVRVETSPGISPAVRNDNSNVRVGGAYMYLSGVAACTTGFTIAEIATLDRGMLSADHCGTGRSGTWHYSSSSATSAEISSYLGMLNVNPLTFDLGRWDGAAGSWSFYPYIFTGGYTDTLTVSAVKAIAVPVVNDEVCYSGSYSGNVCGNVVNLTNVLTCYSITMCYQGQAVTAQKSNIEAAGNGDSGGPVYTGASGGVNGAGIISGIVGGSSTCTGEPGASGGRQCSPSAIYAPAALGLNTTTGWGLLVVP